jgi:hypothetical protein
LASSGRFAPWTSLSAHSPFAVGVAVGDAGAAAAAAARNGPCAACSCDKTNQETHQGVDTMSHEPHQRAEPQDIRDWLLEGGRARPLLIGRGVGAGARN